MKRIAILWWLFALTLWAIAGCNGVTPLADISVVTATAPDEAMTELAFEGNGDTFLDAIATAVNEYGVPVNHRFVDISDDAGQRWQGEALIDGDDQRVFLQRMQSGGGDGLLIEAAMDADISAIIADIDGGGAPVEDASPVFPEIRFVRARENGDGVWSFDVTLAYPDTGWDDYADGWHVETPDGEILGTRILLHPHVNEQPFTRSLSGVAVPKRNTTVLIRSHALINGYGPEPLTIPLDQSTATEFFEVKRDE